MKSYGANELVAIEQKFGIERKLSGEFAVSKKLETDESAFGNKKLSPGEDDSFCNTKWFLTYSDGLSITPLVWYLPILTL